MDHATANDRVVADIAEQLGSGATILRGPLTRRSLALDAIVLENQAERLAWLAEQIPKMAGSGIVYCLTVADTQRVATFLRAQGIDARPYNADLSTEEREGLEDALVANEMKALVATVALGMGFAVAIAWRDAGLTHRRTGVYSTMFVAAAIAAAFVTDEPLTIFSTALGFVPRQSRFYAIIADSLQEVARAGDWEDGYRRIHGKYRQYSHCAVYQEVGTLINTLRFAENVGDGVCKQVMQGNDTDSFGATAGSLLGAYFGPGHLEGRWLEPFHDDIRTKLAGFPERSLTALSQRLGRLPERTVLAGAMT